MYVGLHVKCWLLLADCNGTGIFLDRFSKNTQIPNFMKIRPVGSDLFHADATRLKRVGKGTGLGPHMELPRISGSFEESHEALSVCAVSILNFEPGNS
jgi:hypothetical protein